MNHRLPSLIISALLAPLLAACVGHHLSRDPHQSVRITYVHVANIYQLVTPAGALSPRGTDDRGFWAVFDICSIDIQGMNLKGFTYEAGDFHVTLGDKDVMADQPYRMLATTASDDHAQDDQTRELASDTLGLTPAEQYLPKGAHPGLAYRLAMVFPEWPEGYLGESMTLKNTNPATVLENVSTKRPQQWQQYERASAGPLRSGCPAQKLPAHQGTAMQP